AVADRDERAGLDLAQQPAADDVEGARFAGHAVALADLAERERPQPVRIAEGDDAVARHHDRREGALQARYHVGDGVLDPLRLVRGEEGGDDLRVRRRAKGDTAL